MMGIRVDMFFNENGPEMLHIALLALKNGVFAVEMATVALFLPLAEPQLWGK